VVLIGGSISGSISGSGDIAVSHEGGHSCVTSDTPDVTCEALDVTCDISLCCATAMSHVTTYSFDRCRRPTCFTSPLSTRLCTSRIACRRDTRARRAMLSWEGQQKPSLSAHSASATSTSNSEPLTFRVLSRTNRTCSTLNTSPPIEGDGCV
jgi:hypothetical protein